MQGAKKLVLVSVFLFGSAQALAQNSDRLDQSPVKVNIAYSQQEHGLIHFDLLAPGMGKWGRLGLNLGRASYLMRDSLQKIQAMTASQTSVVWSTDGVLMNLNDSTVNRKLGIVTSLRLGQLEYEILEGTERKTSQFNFFEMDFVYNIRSSLKSVPADKWLQGSSLGIGVGIRNNFIHKPHMIGQTEVNPLRIFPTLQLALYLF